jgi:hypothetical protein
MADIATEIDALHRMTTGELADRYQALHGRTARTRHRAYLIRKLAWRIQAIAEGDLTDRARCREAVTPHPSQTPAGERRLARPTPAPRR